MNCKNCNNPILEDDKFCSNCGGKIITSRLNFQLVWEDFSERVLNWDNKFFRTFLHLFTQPHTVIQNYISGVRKKYIEPFTFLFLAITIGGLSIYLMKETAIFQLENSPNEQNIEGTKRIIDFIFDYNSIMTLFILPFYGIVSWIVFFNKKKYNLLEHSIIYIYTYSFTSILNTLFLALIYFFDKSYLTPYYLIFIILNIAYNAIVLKKLFNLSGVQLLIKILYFLVIGLIFYIIISLLLIALVFLFLGKEGAVELFAPK